MTPQDHRALVARWLHRAQVDLEAAETLMEEADLPAPTICALAQQVAEKALKAILVQLQIDFPKIHDLPALSRLLPEDWAIDISLATLKGLSNWAIEARYPGDWEDPSPDDAAGALNAAIATWDAVMSQFEHHGVKFP